jgi:hypothetical protein
MKLSQTGDARPTGAHRFRPTRRGDTGVHVINRGPSPAPWDSPAETSARNGDTLNTPEILDRDRRRADAIRAQGPASLVYVEYGLTLRNYAVNTLMRQWRKKTLLPTIRRRTRIDLPEPPSQWGPNISGASSALP